MARMMRRDHAEDARHFDVLAANRAKAPDTGKLADILTLLAERTEGDQQIRFMSMATQVQQYADQGRNVTAAEAIQTVEMMLGVLGYRQ